jgi:nucleotide-binding universal stress UspA family protein
MKISTRIVSILMVGCFGYLLSGCAGLRMWERNRYFRTEVKPNLDSNSIQTIGVYAFSNGEQIDGSDTPTDAFDVIETILIKVPVGLLTGSLSFGGPQVGLHKLFYPDEVTAGIVFEPDTSNAGPSLELASAVKEQIEQRGYKAKVVTNIGHSGEISLESCLKHARENGFDAIFVAHYSGLTTWTEFGGQDVFRTSKYTIVKTNVISHTGYLYIPNAALFDVKSGERIWNHCYYGVVQKGHLPNLAGEEFVQVASDALIHNGADDYFKSAPKAAKVLFEPGLWPDSFVEFPTKGEKKRRM